MGGDVIGEVDSIKYLGSFVLKYGDFGMDINIALSAGKLNGKKRLVC